MKKIAFFTQQMLTGGIENALINFVKILPKDRYDVIVYLINYEGGFIEKAEQCCHLETIPMSESQRRNICVGGIRLSFKKNIDKKRYTLALKQLCRFAIGNHEFSELNVNFNKIPSMKESFDIAVCYQMHSPFLVRYVAEKVTAEKKVCWMHNDFATTHYKIQKLKKYLDGYDCYFGNAKQIVKEFITLIPEYAEQTHVIYSVLDFDYMKKQANAETATEFTNSQNKLNFLTIARLEPQKAIDWAAKACRLINSQYRQEYTWFVIGDGSERKKIEKLIQEYDISDNFILLGSRTNPYPYYASCDVYIQTSRHEGFATTISEALLFEKPIVTTRVSGVDEQIEDGVTGIVTNLNPGAIARGIEELLNERRREEIIKAVKQKNVGTQDVVTLFESALR